MAPFDSRDFSFLLKPMAPLALGSLAYGLMDSGTTLCETDGH